MLVLTTHRLSVAYHILGQRLVAEGTLTDSDQVFFFSHEELKALVKEASERGVNSDAWVDLADRRRLALSFQDKLQFDEVCYGYPQPLDYRQTADQQEGLISGRPVSRGIVEGVARVVRSVDEAAGLQPGEILVAPITDVGWTPYFNLIAGLVTDLGSSVSHGAVIAREYGLPAVVNTRVSTRRINTGDQIRLDADKGVVELLNREILGHAASPRAVSPSNDRGIKSGSNHEHIL
jgi:pyruvate,water dikinase